MSIIWRIIGAVIIILGIIGMKKERIGRFWSIIDLSLVPFVWQLDLLFCGYLSSSRPTNSPVTQVPSTLVVATKVSFW